MDTNTYQLTIKKGYASAIIENLRLDGTIELVSDHDIPQWQINESLMRKKKMKENPSSKIDSDTFFNSIADGEI